MLAKNKDLFSLLSDLSKDLHSIWALARRHFSMMVLERQIARLEREINYHNKRVSECLKQHHRLLVDFHYSQMILCEKRLKYLQSVLRESGR